MLFCLHLSRMLDWKLAFMFLSQIPHNGNTGEIIYRCDVAGNK